MKNSGLFLFSYQVDWCTLRERALVNASGKRQQNISMIKDCENNQFLKK